MATTITRKSFGKRVHDLRMSQSYSQEAFADIAGLHRTYIGSIERGEQNVSIDNIARIAKAFKISLYELFRGL